MLGLFPGVRNQVNLLFDLGEDISGTTAQLVDARNIRAILARNQPEPSWLASACDSHPMTNKCVASGTDGSQSQRGTELGRRDGGDLDRPSAARSDATAQDVGQHQRHRVGVPDCGAGLQEREALAWRRATGALGRVRTSGCTKPIPKDHWTQTDSGVTQRIRSAGTVEIGGCQTQKGVVEWVARESLVSTDQRSLRKVWELTLRQGKSALFPNL